MKNKKNRRKFILNSGKLAGGFSAYNIYSNIFQNIIDGSIRKASASNNREKTYVALQFIDAPARWMWDLFLCPYTKSGFKSNPHMITKFIKNSSGRYLEGEYAMINRKGINIPHLWQFDVPAPNGGFRKMTDLLDNMLVLQGISTNNSAHNGSIITHNMPPGSNQSMSAISSDAHPKIISAIGIGQNKTYRFVSTKDLSPLQLPGDGKILDTIKKSFELDKNSNIFLNKKKLETSLSQVNEILNSYAKADSSKMLNHEKIKKSSNSLLKKSFDDIEGYWEPAFNKYNDLINRCLFNSPIPGISDAPIGSTDVANRDKVDLRHKIAVNDLSTTCSHKNLINLIDQNTHAQRIAERFAALEYLLLNDLSSSISVVIQGMSNLHLGNGKYTPQSTDEHGGGALSSAYINGVFYRAVSACLLELFEQLKNKNIFQKIVFDVSGDFNRIPINTMQGSNHGWEGKSVALYSGAIKGPLILGETIADNDPYVKATWGKGNGSVSIADLTSTIAHLLNAPSPISSVKSAVTVDSNGNMTNHIPKTKIIT